MAHIWEKFYFILKNKQEDKTKGGKHRDRQSEQLGARGENGDLGNNKANPQPENRMTNDSNYIFSPVIMSFFYAPLFSQGRSKAPIPAFSDTRTTRSKWPSVAKPNE